MDEDSSFNGEVIGGSVETAIDLGGARQFDLECPASLRSNFENEIGCRACGRSIEIGTSPIARNFVPIFKLLQSSG